MHQHTVDPAALTGDTCPKNRSNRLRPPAEPHVAHPR
ncbi:hypothetical protein GA0115256_10276 [Streptomyces sp. DconLS]|nr:hypothetical protein GA0115256_10276 [Streptomyces sp. DconLS]SCF78806.1 hypothetical protein GA0115258_1124153 [Streptomyces sp. LamerLS-31b]